MRSKYCDTLMVIKDTTDYKKSFAKELAACTAGNPQVVDGVIFTYDVAQYLWELKRKLPGVIAGVQNCFREVQTEAWLYFDGDPYCLGRVMFTDSMYTVESHLIHNRRYSEWRDEYKRVGSSNLKTATKKALQYLRRLQPEDICGITLNKYESEITKHINEAWLAHRQAFDGLLGKKERIYTELTYIIASGYTFRDSDLQQKLEVLIEADRVKKSHDVPLPIVHVCVTKDMDADVVDTTYIPDVKHAKQRHAPVRYTIADIPEELRRRLAVLAIDESEAFIQGIGMKAQDNIYYVVGDYEGAYNDTGSVFG